MSTSLLYHTQNIKNYYHVNHDYSNGVLTWTIIRSPKKFRCPACQSQNVIPHFKGYRKIVGLPVGSKKTIFRVIVHRLKCLHCEAYKTEELEFIPLPKCHYTKAVANKIIELRNEMTISAISKQFGLHWNTVKDIEKVHLKKKYSEIPLSEVRDIGVDEVHIGKNGFFTIVRNMRNGDVLFVGEGKSVHSLAPFTKRIKRFKDNIQSIAIDLGATYTAWAKEHLPKAAIVYDKFHVIQLMNNKVNAVRRRTMNELEETDKKALKGQMYTLLRNEENLDLTAAQSLAQIRNTYQDLGEISLMKECLRNVYMIAEFEEQAKLGFVRWIALAIETGVPELKTMAKTIKDKFEGISAYWKNKLTSASMEGFNNKIGWLNRQAYGYRDLEYFKLKIYALPKMKTVKSL